MYKKIKIKNPWLMNPFLGYGLFWSLAIFLYIISPSKMNLKLDDSLLVFLSLTILIAFIFAYFFNKKYKNKEFKVRERSTYPFIIILLISYLVEIVYSGQIPLFKTFLGVSGAYKNYGLPMWHVPIVTASMFFGVYNAFLFLVFKKRSYLWFTIIVLTYFCLIFSRGMLIFCALCCVLLYFINKKIKIHHVMYVSLLALVGGWLFGILGNIRSGSSWNDSSILLDLAKIDGDPKGIFSPFYWIEEYIICSLRNLNYNVYFKPNYSFEGFLYTIIPDFIAKRVLVSQNSAVLLVPEFTTSTMYADTYVNFGYTGMWISFLLYMVIACAVLKIRIRDASCKIVSCSMLFFLFAMSIFDNMVIYSGYSLALVIAILFGLVRMRTRIKISANYSGLPIQSDKQFTQIKAQQVPKCLAQKSIAKNSVFYLIYTALNVIFPFITGIYVARILLPDSIGQVAYAQNIAQYFVIFAFLGIPTYGLREISKARNNKEDLNNIYSELFFLNLISTVIFTCVYLVLIFSIPNFRGQYQLFLITGLAIALNALDNSWLYEGLEEFKFISIRNLIFKVVSFILLILFVRNAGDYYAYAIITIVGVAGNNLLNFLFSKKFVTLKVHGINIKRHLKPVMLLVVVNFAIEVYTLVDTTMLGIFCPKENVAYYTYGSKINKIFLQIVNTFTMVIVPRITLYYKEGKIEEFNQLLTNTLKIILILSIPLIIGIQFVSQFFICKVYGDAYLNSAYVLKILSIVLLISPIGYLLGSRVILSVGKEWKMIVCVGTGAVVNIIGNLVLIPLYQEYGAAVASVIGEVVVMVVYLIFGFKYFHLKRFWDTILRVLAAGVIMGGFLFGASYIPLNGWALFVIQFIGAVLIYALLLLLFREPLVFNQVTKFKNKFIKHKEKIQSKKGD